MKKLSKKTATKLPPETPTDWPPKGIMFENRPGRKQPFLARWLELDVSGKRTKKKTSSYKSEEDRDKFVRDWVKQKEGAGIAGDVLSPKDLQMWKAFKGMVGNTSPIEVARFWVQHNGSLGGNITVAQAIKKYPSFRKKEMTGHAELHLERLEKAFGDRVLSAITPGELVDWLADLRLPRTGDEKPSTTTIRQHVKSIRAFWSVAVVQRWTLNNAAAGVPLREDKEDLGDEVNILTLEETQKLFEANRDALCVGRLALEAFGGLRYSSAARLRGGDIVWEDKGIVMPGKKHKSGARHFVSGWPDNLFRWLRHAHLACWDIPPRNYLDLKREAFVRAGLKAEDDAMLDEKRRNALRHSFASYHLALHRNQQLTGYLMTKTSISSLNNDYRGRATKSDAEGYFGILP